MTAPVASPRVYAHRAAPVGYIPTWVLRELVNIEQGIAGRAAETLVPYARLAAETGSINQLFEAFDLRRYGGDPSGRTTSTQAFRTAIEVADNSTLIRSPAVGDVGAYSGSAPAVIISAP